MGGTLARIQYQIGKDAARKAHTSWYRGEHCHFLPSQANLAEPDAIDKYVCSGWIPTAPFIKKSDKVLTFGSCFAKEVQTRLRKRGIDTTGRIDTRHIPVVRQAAGINNTFAVRQQFEWAFLGKKPNESLWWDANRNQVEAIEEDRKLTQQVFAETDVFIITLGLAEVWFNKSTGEVFWRAIPRTLFDPNVHGFKLSSVEENTNNLTQIHHLIRTFVPDASIIFTLSPVPLVATFRPVSCVTANSVSKAVMRVSVDNLMQSAQDDRLFYWPSYEIVNDIVAQPYQEDNRHVRPEVVDLIMDRFERFYLVQDRA